MSRHRPAMAGDYILSLKELLEKAPASEVVPYDRVSSRNAWKEKLEDRQGPFLRLLAQHGVRAAVGADGEDLVYHETGSGIIHGSRDVLEHAMKAAGRLGIPLVAPCPSRFVRSDQFHCTKRPNVQPSHEDYAELIGRAKLYGAPLATLLPPNSTPAEEKQFLAELSKEATGRIGGRPRKLGRPCRDDPRNMAQWLPLVLERLRNGDSIAEVVRMMEDEAGVSVRTAYRWVKAALDDGWIRG